MHQLQPPTRIHRYHWRKEQSIQSRSENKRDNKSKSFITARVYLRTVSSLPLFALTETAWTYQEMGFSLFFSHSSYQVEVIETKPEKEEGPTCSWAPKTWQGDTWRFANILYSTPKKDTVTVKSHFFPPTINILGLPHSVVGFRRNMYLGCLVAPTFSYTP